MDIKKVISSPQNEWEAVTAMIKSEHKLIDAIHIMESIIENPDRMEFHNKRIKEFLEQFN